jgi:hypothetical protein
MDTQDVKEICAVILASGVLIGLAVYVGAYQLSRIADALRDLRKDLEER